MPVLTKINTNVIADDAITGDKFAGDAYLSNTANQNISGTYAESRMYTSDAYTLTGDTTVNANLVLSSVKGDDSDITLTADSTTRTLTGTGVLSGGGTLQGRNTLTGMTGELGSTVIGAPAITGLGTVTSGTLGSGVTGGSGLTALGTVTAGNLSNTAIVYPAGHVVKVTSKVLTGSGNDLSASSTSAYDSDANDLDVTATAGNILHIFIAGGRIYSGTGYVAAGIRVEDGGSSSNTDYRKSWAYQAGEIHGAVFQHHTVGGSGSVSLKIKRLVWDKEGGTTIYWNSNEGGVYVSFQVFEVQG